MRTSNFALRLQRSLLEEARALADSEGVALNQLINVALAEKLAATRTAAFFRRYTRGANIQEAIAILNRPRKGEPPREGDELPEGWPVPETTAPMPRAQAAAPKTRRRTTRKK